MLTFLLYIIIKIVKYILKTHGEWTMIIGYARVSTEDQTLHVQEQAIQ